MPYVTTEKSTQHGLNTPHGLSVPHKLPSNVLEFSTLFDLLTKQLYPTGRAWNLPEFEDFDNFHKGINKLYGKLASNGLDAFDAYFPDNNNFTEEDASFLEYKFGLIDASNLSLAERKQALIRKMAFPSNIKARQGKDYIQYQLRLAGFDVYLHENTQPYKSPEEVTSISAITLQHGGDTQHGNSTIHGAVTYAAVGNSIYENETVSIGSEDNLWATFFIGGLNLGDIAEVPENRQQEFRELILKLKPAHTVAFLLVNYI